MSRFLFIVFCFWCIFSCVFTATAQDEKFSSKSGVVILETNAKIYKPDSSVSDLRYKSRILWDDWGLRRATYSTHGSSKEGELQLVYVRSGADIFQILRKTPNTPWLLNDTIVKVDPDKVAQLLADGNVNFSFMTNPLRPEDGWTQEGVDVVLGRECSKWRRKIEKDSKRGTGDEQVCLWRGLFLKKENNTVYERKQIRLTSSYVATHIELDPILPPETLELPRDIPIEDLAKVMERAKVHINKILESSGQKLR